jgi:transcriptional regulator with XRE-family HTH domain
MKKPTDPEELKLARKIGEKVRTLRLSKGLKQTGLADLAEISDYKVVGFVEQAATFPSLRTLLRLSKALKTPLYKFFK